MEESEEKSFSEEELETESDEEIIYRRACSVSFNQDFRENIDGSGEDIFSEKGLETERYPMIEDNLDNGIIIRYPEKYKLTVPYTSRPLPVQLRSIQLAELRQTVMSSKLITDMFGVYHKYSTDSDKLASISFSDTCEGEIRMSVTVRAKLSPHFEYHAHLRRNGNWVKFPVQMEDNVAGFEGGTFDILFLTSTPIIETITLGPEGKEFISKYDNRIKLNFPRNCVLDTEILQVQIIPQSNDGPIYMDEQPCIIGATKSIHVNHRKGIFKEPIEMHLELCLFDNSTDPDLTKYDFVDVHAVNRQELAFHQLPAESYSPIVRGFSLCMKVTDFDSHSVQLGIHHKMATETGKLRARMAHGEIFHCHILIFMSENIQNYQGKSIRVDCVENKDVQNTIDKLQGVNYGFTELTRCRSPPLFISDGERIRVSLRGGIKLPWEFRKDQMIISFLLEGLHKHIVFPVVTKFGNRPTNLGYFDFNRAEGRNELLYQTFFDVDFPIRRTRLEYSSETTSLTSIVLPSHSRQPTHGVISEATSLQSINESGFDSTSTSRASSPEGHRSTTVNVMLNINNALSKMLINANWKFVFRAILHDSELSADSIISEAEKNNSGDVREAIYSALTTWTRKTNLTTSRQMFDAIIRGLKKENYEQIANELTKEYEHNAQS